VISCIRKMVFNIRKRTPSRRFADAFRADHAHSAIDRRRAAKTDVKLRDTA
jgi:hypothetical protein